MSKFFKSLNNKVLNNKLKEYIYEVIDWLFDDKKFSKDIWEGKTKDKEFIGKRTKLLNVEIKKACKFDTKNFIYKNKLEELSFEKTTKGTYAAFECSDAIAKELIRHIRNAIAHSNTNFRGEKYIEFIDYNKSGSRQTAYIYITYDQLFDIYDKYLKVKKIEF